FSRLHYRSIDVSGIEQEMARDGYSEQIAAWRAGFVPSNAHRALGDIRDSIRQLAALRTIRRSGTAAPGLDHLSPATSTHRDRGDIDARQAHRHFEHN
ncbi:MAG: hypothetical protein L0G94_08865, partial [Brachybacterium sp.]|nr:hypothetical protein [Brachybacterium sp.]